MIIIVSFLPFSLVFRISIFRRAIPISNRLLLIQFSFHLMSYWSFKGSTKIFFKIMVCRLEACLRRWLRGTYFTRWSGLIVLLLVNRLTLPRLFSFAVVDSGLSNVWISCFYHIYPISNRFEPDWILVLTYQCLSV